MIPMPVRFYAGVLPPIRRRGHTRDVQPELSVPVAEIEVPAVSDSILPSLRTRVQALVEAALERR